MIKKLLKFPTEYELLERKRISSVHVRAIRSRYFQNSTGKIVLLTDQDNIVDEFDKDRDYLVVNCNKASVSDFNVLGYENFIYACDNSDIGMPFVKKIIKAQKKYISVHVGAYVLARFLEEDIVAKKVLLDLHKLQTTEGFNKFVYGPGADFINICQLLERTKHLPGAYVEFGCYRGSSGQIAVKYMADKEIFRKSVFVDVFEGFTYEEAQTSADALWLGTHKVEEGMEVVRERLQRFSLPERGLSVDVRKANIISENCLDDIHEIALANIDVDLYEATLASLQKIFPKVVRGGCIILECPGHHPVAVGARVALDEFLQTLSPTEYILILMASGQFLLFKM